MRWLQIRDNGGENSIAGSDSMHPGCRRPSDLYSPFGPRPNYAVVSSVLVALLCAVSNSAQAAIINAASPSHADVTAAIKSARDGDTVILPAGTAAWTSHLTITKGITIRGETTTNSDNGTANDQTVLVDNLVRVAGGQGFFQCTTAAGKSLRITGITFSGVNGLTTQMNNGAIRLSGTSDQVRIDHCHFTYLRHHPHIRVNQTIYGVSDHLVIDNAPSQTQGWHIHNGTGNGDLEFSQSAGYGGPKFWFIEDCHIRNTTGPNSAGGGIDGHTGAKYVVRHNHLFNFINLFHGTESARFRGGRAMEIYNNDFHWTYTTTMYGIRSGSLIAHDNTFYGNVPKGWGMGTYRSFCRFTSAWLGGSGDNPWDLNVTEPDGTHVEGHPPYLFEHGRVSSGSENLSSGVQYLTDTTKHWTTNQWAGYTAKRLSDNWIGKILSNDPTTLTMHYYEANGVQQARWRAGDQYQIRKVLAALDQPCRGRGDLITGDPPINSTTGTPAWPHQEIEPSYSWNNVHSPGGEHVNFRPAINAPLLLGRDYFNDTPMPGYTPYTYPHPLTKGLPLPEQMTQKATGNSQHNASKKRRPWGGKNPDRKKAKKAKENHTNGMAEAQKNHGD